MNQLRLSTQHKSMYMYQEFSLFIFDKIWPLSSCTIVKRLWPNLKIDQQYFQIEWYTNNLLLTILIPCYHYDISMTQYVILTEITKIY